MVKIGQSEKKKRVVIDKTDNIIVPHKIVRADPRLKCLNSYLICNYLILFLLKNVRNIAVIQKALGAKEIKNRNLVRPRLDED